jgi:hypothetical protein
LTANDTAADDTPARAATSSIVGLRGFSDAIGGVSSHIGA